MKTIIQQESGIDLIIGNNFIRLYSPFVQTLETIKFTLRDEFVAQSVAVQKETEAFKWSVPNYVEAHKKQK